MTRRRTPAVLVCGIDEKTMLAATVSLQFSTPGAVVMRHSIDPAAQRLTRIVSDLTGIIETEHIDLEHACVQCAIREDIVPSLQRLASSGRWTAVIACLPVTAEPVQVCRVAAWQPQAMPHVRIASVVAALDHTRLLDDLIGDDLVTDRNLATALDDERGVAEVACAMVEYSDALCLTGEITDEEAALLRTLARPGASIVHDPTLLDASLFDPGLHRPKDTEAWVAEVRRYGLPELSAGPVWRLDLRSDRALHPERLHDHVEVLGGGPRRSRGCFWLPTRSSSICMWDAAGGQVSVGAINRWRPGEAPMTRLIVHGLDDGYDEIVACFEHCLLTDTELASRGTFWEQSTDGLEPWLGPIRHAA